MQKNCIKELRELNELSLAELGRITGIGAQTIGSWEKGHHVPIKHIAKLAKAFGVSEEEVVWEETSDHREITYIGNPFEAERIPDVRPQIDCFCGNCDFWKIRNGIMNRCCCTTAEKYGYFTGRNYLCVNWHRQGLAYSDVLTVIPEDGILWKNVMAAIMLKGIGVDQVLAELDISYLTWKDYCKGLKAMPLQQLAKLSELCEISADRLVKDYSDNG